MPSSDEDFEDPDLEPSFEEADIAKMSLSRLREELEKRQLEAKGPRDLLCRYLRTATYKYFVQRRLALIRQQEEEEEERHNEGPEKKKRAKSMERPKKRVSFGGKEELLFTPGKPIAQCNK